MGRGGRVGGFPVHVDGFSHKPGAGAVAQHQIHVRIAVHHQGMGGDGEIDVVELSAAQELAFSSGAVDVVGAAHLVADAGALKFLRGHREDGGGSVKALCHLRVA